MRVRAHIHTHTHPHSHARTHTHAPTHTHTHMLTHTRLTGSAGAGSAQGHQKGEPRGLWMKGWACWTGISGAEGTQVSRRISVGGSLWAVGDPESWARVLTWCWAALPLQRGTYLPQTYIIQEEMVVTEHVSDKEALGSYVPELASGGYGRPARGHRSPPARAWASTHSTSTWFQVGGVSRPLECTQPAYLHCLNTLSAASFQTPRHGLCSAIHPPCPDLCPHLPQQPGPAHPGPSRVHQ